MEMLLGIMVPFLGTTLGAGCVFFVKKALPRGVERSLTGFAGGVMTAAAVWGLLIPAMEYRSDLGSWAFLPAMVGFWLGVLFLLLLDQTVPHMHLNDCGQEGRRCGLSRTAMLVAAVALHNLPEGVAVGVAYAGSQSGSGITAASALTLSLAIALQNFPEGAIIALPLRAEGTSRKRAFFFGALSGAVEPLGAFLALAFASLAVPGLPYLLGFAAGAMIYVVVEELIPEMSAGEHSNVGTLFFAIGFTLMIAMDMLLG
jgi:ZIP family zinc transporter